MGSEMCIRDSRDTRTEINGGGGLGDPALLIRDGYDDGGLIHGSFFEHGQAYGLSRRLVHLVDTIAFGLRAPSVKLGDGKPDVKNYRKPFCQQT